MLQAARKMAAALAITAEPRDRNQSQRPFLLDQEILTEDSDLDRLWELLESWRLPEGEPQILALEGGLYDFADYRDSLELRAFRNLYLPPGFVVYRMAFGGQEILLLVGDARDGYPEIHGMRLAQ